MPMCFTRQSLHRHPRIPTRRRYTPERPRAHEDPGQGGHRLRGRGRGRERRAGARRAYAHARGRKFRGPDPGDEAPPDGARHHGRRGRLEAPGTRRAHRRAARPILHGAHAGRDGATGSGLQPRQPSNQGRGLARGAAAGAGDHPRRERCRRGRDGRAPRGPDAAGRVPLDRAARLRALARESSRRPAAIRLPSTPRPARSRPPPRTRRMRGCAPGSSGSPPR